MKRILLTGAAGFIGSSACNAPKAHRTDFIISGTPVLDDSQSYSRFRRSLEIPSPRNFNILSPIFELNIDTQGTGGSVFFI